MTAGQSPRTGASAEASPVRRPGRVTLTMIVRDEKKNLPACLESVSGLFDQIVVVDTGSVDRTREIVREQGDMFFEFPWVDDFAAARNASTFQTYVRPAPTDKKTTDRTEKDTQKRRSDLCFGSLIRTYVVPRHDICPDLWGTPRAITCSGLTPMTSSSRRSGRSCGTYWTVYRCQVARTRAKAKAVRWASRVRSTHPTGMVRLATSCVALANRG